MSASGKLRRSALVTALAAPALFSLALAASASAAVQWTVNSRHASQHMAPGGAGQYLIDVRNVGDTASSGACPGVSCVTVIDKLPAGVQATGFSVMPDLSYLNSWNCVGTTIVTCRLAGANSVPGIGSGAHQGGVAPLIEITVKVDPGVSGTAVNQATVSGGGALASASDSDPTPFSTEPAGFGITPGTFVADAFDGDGEAAAPEHLAGSRPAELRTDFEVNLRFADDPARGGRFAEPEGQVRRLSVTLPAGLIGNPQSVSRCPARALTEEALGDVGVVNCPIASQIGIVGPVTDDTIETVTEANRIPVYNMVPPPGALAAFAFVVSNTPIWITAHLDPSDYSVVAGVQNLTATLAIQSSALRIWGVPADPEHDRFRADPSAPLETPFGIPSPEAADPKPFLSMPTQCTTPVSTRLDVSSWETPVATDSASSEPATMSGCSQLAFEPTITAKPTTNLAEAPSGLEFDLQIPQNEDPEGRATPQLKDAVVTLPEGMTVNPPSAQGLGACSLAQIGMSSSGVPNGDPVSCPGASKLGTVTAVTPALEDPVQGSVYLAEQGNNPFGSLLALYLVLEQPERGLLVKLAGEVKADPTTGRLTTIFRQNPQLPLSELKLDLAGGPRAPLKTPGACGNYATQSTLTPWSSPETPDATPSDSFELTGGPDGGNCAPTGAAAPNAPSFSAGTLDPAAGAYSPFVLNLSRADGSQQIKAIDTTLPKGLLGKLAGISYCSDAALAAAAAKSGRAEQASPSCPAASAVGSADIAAGAGSLPLHVAAKAYLAGPYKGAPLSLAIITPAVAGPFDLGTVVVRTALNLNPQTAQIHAVSDPIPQILQGIPLNVRSISLSLDRPSFTLNPTSCDPTTISGSAISIFGLGAPLSNPFQVGGCQGLGFKPKLAISLKGGTKRSEHPALSATLKARPGDANIARTVVSLPHSEFLAQDHIRTVCTRVQFAAGAGNGAGCPKGSVYGTAKAWSPLLDQPLSGPVFLRSNPEHELPDLVAALGGQIEIELVGRIDSKNGGIRTTFESVPDAPVSKFVLSMQGGKKGLLENSRDLCKHPAKASVLMDGQNGKVADSTVGLAAKCPKKGSGGKGKRERR